MQNISIKVYYKSKTLIIGKGLITHQQIFDELAKRFAEIKQIKSSLIIEYENGAQTLEQAYQLAIKQGLKSIKLKVKQVSKIQQSCIYEQLNQSQSSQLNNIQIQDIKIQENVQIQSKPGQKEQKPQSQLQQKKEVQNIQLQTPKQYLTELQKQTIDIDLIKKSNGESEQKLLVDGLAKGQQKADINIEQKQDELQKQLQKKSQKQQNKLLLIDQTKKSYSTIKQQQIQQKPIKQQEESIKNQNLTNLSNQSLQKQFNMKFNFLQNQFDSLQQKYDDLSTKYQCLILVLGQDYNLGSSVNNKKSKSKQKEGFIKNENKNHFFKNQSKQQGYIKLPQKDPSEKFGSYSLNQYFAEITQFQPKEEIKVGESLIPKFIIKNVGKKRWPQKIFVLQETNNQFIMINSLNPNQDMLVSFNEQKGNKEGQKINRVYQLMYYDENSDIKKFGRIFGISLRVKGFEQKNKVKVNKNEEYGQYKNYLNELIGKNRIRGRSVGELVSILEEYDINEKTYKNIGQQTLVQIIRSM